MGFILHRGGAHGHSHGGSHGHSHGGGHSHATERYQQTVQQSQPPSGIEHGQENRHSTEAASITVVGDGSDSSDVESGHGDDHGSHAGKRQIAPTNINVRAAFIHVIGDFLQSLGVLVAALVIYFKVRSSSTVRPLSHHLQNLHFSHIWVSSIQFARLFSPFWSWLRRWLLCGML